MMLITPFSTFLAVFPYKNARFFHALFGQILNQNEQAELVVEFKFEPSKMRKNEICIHKLPVVAWPEVLEDINRIKRFVENKAAKCGAAILIDEFGRHRNSAHMVEGSTWINWGDYNSKELNLWILYTEIPCSYSSEKKGKI